MRKKFIVAFLALSVLAVAGCGKEQPADTHVTEKVSVSDEDELINEDNTDIEKTEDTLDFSEFQDRWFYFASGVGGWRTVLQIKEDGSFSGTFSDSDMGSTGEGYPGGTYYFSDFHGKFSTPVKVNEYTYSMKIEEIGYENEVGTEEIKIRKKGNSGSHNGMKSIVENLGTIEFPRIRIGIGKPKENEDKIKFVIGKLSNKTKEELEKGTTKAVEAVTEILKNGIDTAMNKFN